MRRFIAAGVLAGLLALAPSALAQDGDSAAPWRFESRAIDYSAMLQSQHGAQGGQMTEVAIPSAQLRVLVRAPGRDSTTLDATTDLVGHFVLEGPTPPPGATLEFFIAGQDGSESRPGYYGRPWALDDGPAPDAIPFYTVATEVPRGLILGNVINIVTTVDRDETTKVVQLRHTAMLHNRDFQVWLGDLSRNEFSTFGVRIPPGFELRSVTVNNQAVDATDVGPAGHGDEEKWLFRQPIFPSFDGPLVFQVLFVAPYVEGREYDVSWHNEYPVMSYMLNLEQGSFGYVPPEAGQGLELVDGGVNPAMGNVQKVTHSYQLQQIPPHQTLSARFVAGTPFPWTAVKWTAAIVLIVLGAALLGFVASRPRDQHATEVASAKKRVKVPGTAEGREHELEMLDRRLRRGEITSVEHQVRRAAIMKAAEAAPAKGAAPRSEPGGAGVDIDAIAARVEHAPAEQLRADVRALLKAVRRQSGAR